MLQDLRSALRGFAKSPGLTLLSVVILAVGLGASLTVYSWVQSLVLRPFPAVRDQGALRTAWINTPQGDWIAFSIPDLVDLQRELAGQAMVSGVELGAVSVHLAGEPERAFGGIVSGNFFELLGLTPQHGRFFRPDEDEVPGKVPVVVLADAFWRHRLGADPAVIGQPLTVNGQVFRVIGIAPRGFRGSEVGLSLDLWLPLAMQPVVAPGAGRHSERGAHWLRTLVRPAPGVDDRQLQARVGEIGRRLAAAYPDSNAGQAWTAGTLARAPWGASAFMAPVMAVLAAMVLLVVLVTAANVAGLLVARGLGRRREMAVRLALGAGRGRLVRQLLVESLLLAAAAGLLGWAIARQTQGALLALMPPLPYPVATHMELGLDGVVLAVALVAAIAVLSGLAPAVQTTGVSVEGALREESAAVGGGRRRHRLRAALVVGQLALCCVLLAAGALCLRALGVGRGIAPGFRPDHQLLAAIDLFPNGYDEARGLAFQQLLIEHLEALPGVRSASLARRLPLDVGGTSSAYLTVEGYAPAADEELLVHYNAVGPRYLETMGIDLAEGRDFVAADRAGAPDVAVVSETMARRYWPAGRALGGRFGWRNRTFTVIGLARDVRERDLDEAPTPYFWLPLAQHYRPQTVIHVRTVGEPLALAPALRATLRDLDPTLPLFAVKSMTEHLQIAVFKQRIAAATLMLFGGVALLLAGVGLYGVVAFAFGQRRRELGLRAALGATPRDLVRLLLGEGTRLALWGLALGLAGAVAVGQLLRGLLLGVSPLDPAAFAGVLGLLAAVVFLASFLPARRAARLDPSAALRQE